MILQLIFIFFRCLSICQWDYPNNSHTLRDPFCRQKSLLRPMPRSSYFFWGYQDLTYTEVPAYKVEYILIIPTNRNKIQPDLYQNISLVVVYTSQSNSTKFGVFGAIMYTTALSFKNSISYYWLYAYLPNEFSIVPFRSEYFLATLWFGWEYRIQVALI